MQKRTRLAMIVLAALFLMGQSSVPGVLVLDGSTVKGRATTLVCGDNLACSFAGGTVTMDASGSGSGAPADATYITQTGSAGLSAEQALAALGTGLVKNTTTTGVLSIFAGNNCIDNGSTGSRAYGIDAAGTLLCDYANVTTASGILPVNRGGTGATTATADTVMIGDGSAWNRKTIPDCPAEDSHLNYDASTDTLSCETNPGGGDWTMAASSSSTATSTNPGGAKITGVSVSISDGVATALRCRIKTLSASSGIGAQINVSVSGSPTGLVWSRTGCLTTSTTSYFTSTTNGAWDTQALAHPIQSCLDYVEIQVTGSSSVVDLWIRPETGGTTVTAEAGSYCEYRIVN